MGYRVRRAELAVNAALADTRVVAITGARQVGKSTLVKHVLRRHPRSLERQLDRAADLAAARNDPARFVRHDGLLAIDEIQRLPELVLAIKAEVDADPRPGRFLLTGSARLMGLRDLPDSLVGRMETIELWPFSQGELERTADDFIDRLFEDEPRVGGGGSEDRDGYVERMCRGGFHEATQRESGRREKYFAAYVNDLIDRDVRQLADISRKELLRTLGRALAARSGQLLKIEALASDLALPATTIERYVSLFEEIFAIKRIAGWTASSTTRAVSARKLFFVDSGLCSHLVGRSAKRLKNDDVALGPLLETFVLSELARQLSFSEERASLHHFRTRDGVEVDAVIETADGRLAGIEVKSGETVRGDDFNSLRHLQARTGDRFHCGVVLHTGKYSLPFGEKFFAVPIDALWAAKGIRV